MSIMDVMFNWGSVESCYVPNSVTAAQRVEAMGTRTPCMQYTLLSSEHDVMMTWGSKLCCLSAVYCNSSECMESSFSCLLSCVAPATYNVQILWLPHLLHKDKISTLDKGDVWKSSHNKEFLHVTGSNIWYILKGKAFYVKWAANYVLCCFN